MKTLFLNHFKKAATLAALTGFGLLSAGPAMSAHIAFDEIGDTTTASATQFDVTPATIIHTNIFNGEDDIRVTGSFLTNTAAGLSGNSNAAMLEPGCVGNVCASDFIHVSWTTRVNPNGGFAIADIIAEFGSDPESLGGFICGVNGLCIVENGQVQDITGLLNLPANITMTARSDIDEAVPEPATLALLGLGLAGLGFSRRKR